MSHPHLANEPTALYRLYDSGRRLLYIGITHAPEARWTAHAATKQWWPDVAHKAVTWFETRAGAEAAEKAAIGMERTVYNVEDSPWAPKPRGLAANELTVGGFTCSMAATLQRAARGDLLWIVSRRRSRDRQAAVVPADLGEAIVRVGGAAAALEIIERHEAS